MKERFAIGRVNRALWDRYYQILEACAIQGRYATYIMHVVELNTAQVTYAISMLIKYGMLITTREVRGKKQTIKLYHTTSKGRRYVEIYRKLLEYLKGLPALDDPTTTASLPTPTKTT